MRKTVVLFALAFVICSVGSYAQSPSERKFSSLQNAENTIFKLGFDFDTLQNYIYPKIEADRSTLAPNYPDITTLPRTIEARNEAFLSWIEDHPAEYEAYYTYIRDFLNQHRPSNQ